jgi:hypothetical protein
VIEASPLAIASRSSGGAPVVQSCTHFWTTGTHLSTWSNTTLSTQLSKQRRIVA